MQRVVHKLLPLTDPLSAQSEHGMTRATWMVLDAEPTEAQATLPSGNALNDCQGWSGTPMLNCEPTGAPEPASYTCAANDEPDFHVRSMRLGP
jgi:hypothetical protein